jgi:hypothetical protein
MARVLVIGSGQQIEGLDEVGPGVAGLARGLFQPLPSPMGRYRGRIARPKPAVPGPGACPGPSPAGKGAGRCATDRSQDRECVYL